MDQKLVYAKTPIGDEAVRQSTRVVQRNLRMMLVQVDGKLSVAELGAKLGDPKMVERSLRELEEGGFIAPTLEAVSVWQESRLRVDRLRAAAASGASKIGASSLAESDTRSDSGNFSSFGKPIQPAKVRRAEAPQDGEPIAPRRSRLVFGLIGLVALLAVAVAGALFFPYSRFKPAIEAELSRLWRVPVSVGNVHLNLLPRSFLLVSDVRIGAGGESVLRQLRVFEPYSMLGSGTHKLSRVEISGGIVTTEHLMTLTDPAEKRFEDRPKSSPKTVVFDAVSIKAGELIFGQLIGEATFDNNGRLENTTLETVDRSLRIAAQPSPEGLLLALEGVGWRPSDELALTFDSLQAKGVLQKDRLAIQRFDTHALGGVLTGSWRLDWSNGLAMAGDATLERLDCRKLVVHLAPSVPLEGELMGILRLQSTGTSWQSMWAKMDATLDAIILRGAFNGVDLGEVARRGPGSTVRAGTTKFDRLAVKMTIDRKQVVGRDLSMNAGLFTATGQFVALRDRQVDSNLLVNMQTSATLRTLPIKVSGTLPNLQAISAR